MSHPPSRRMAAPAVMWEAPPAMVVTGLRGGLDLVTEVGRTPFDPAWSSQLIASAAAGLPVVCDTATTVSRLVKSHPDPHGGQARWFELMSTIPLGSRVVVAHRSMDAAYLHPEGKTARLGQWCSELGIDPVNPYPVVAHLAAGSASDKQHSYARQLAKAEDRLAELMTGWGLGTSMMNLVYTILDQAVVCSRGYVGCDPLAGRELVERGESVDVRVLRSRGDNVTVSLSSPCRIRTGEVMVVDGRGNSPGNVDLVRVRWADGGLVGTLQRAEKRKKGIDALLDAGEGRIMDEPFTVMPRNSGSSVWAKPQTALMGETMVCRHVPDHIIALAQGTAP